ncbi:glycosyl transferase family protein, partial [Pandoraea pneumonica]
MAKGWLDDETLAEAIAFQADLERGALDLAQLRAHADLLPLDTVIRHRVLPQGEDAAGHVVLLVASPLPDAELAQVAAELQRDVVQRIVREG